MHKKHSLHWGGILLVTGTCIGAGMIGVPVKTAVAGLYPTILALILFFLITTWSALLLMEVSLAFKGEINLISMIKEVLGNLHKNIAWVVYLLFMYSIFAGYTSGGASMVQQIIPMHMYLAIPVFLLPFALVIYLGAKYVDFVNRFLTIGLIGAFILLAFTTIVTAQTDTQPTQLLLIGDFKAVLFALPILSTTFSYQMIIPSLKSYLQEKISPLKQSIWIGGIISLIVYVVWQLSVSLLIPAEGHGGLINMSHIKQNPTESIINYLAIHSQCKGTLVFIGVFIFCALTSSLLGTGWALSDFLADGLNIPKNRRGRLLLGLLSFIPPIIYTLCFPNGFLKAIGFAGALSAILVIIYPVLMVWKLRSKQYLAKHNHQDNLAKHNHQDNFVGTIKYKAPVNNITMLIILLIGWLIVGLEFVNNI